MAQNITLLGASYTAVPAVTLPKTGGGTARFDDASITTATASDVASGKVFLASDGTITTGTSSGGGGASNIVTGTFTGTTTGAAMDVTLNYSGSGYPVFVVVFPTGGIIGNSSFNSLVQQYALGIYSVTKRDMTTAPKYLIASPNDDASVYFLYKNSASSATSYLANYNNNTSNPYANSQATSSVNTRLRIRSATQLSVYIASTSYGFAANVEYTYYVIYSS